MTGSPPLRRRRCTTWCRGCGPRCVREGPAATVLTRAPGYLLRVDPADLDAMRFEQLAGRGRDELAGDPSAAAESLQEALALWRGAAYAEFADEDFARPEAARLEALRAATVEDLAEALLASGRPADAVPRLEQLLADEPLRERARGQLMLAHYRNGEQAEALNDFAAHRERLADELGVDPSPALQRLQQQVLRQDPELDPAPVRRAAAGAAPDGEPASHPAAARRSGDDDLAALAEAVQPGSVVTLTGPGGVGKTSLAVGATHDLATRFPDGSGSATSRRSPRTDDLPLAVSSVLDLPTSSGRRRRGEPAGVPGHPAAAAGAGQLRARARRRGGAGARRAPAGARRRGAGHQPRAARRTRREGAAGEPAAARRTPSGSSSTAPAGDWEPSSWRRTPSPWRRSAGGWTGCRWPSSWPLRGWAP